MRTTTGSVHSKPPTNPTYSPSVPLSVYRELASELQAAQSKLDALTTKNHQLGQENQLLRQEIAKVIQSCLHLQKLLESSTANNSQPAPPAVEVKSQTNQPVAEARPRQQVPRVPPQKKRREDSGDKRFPTPERVYIEEQEVRYYASTNKEVKELGGWWLMITMLLIMVTAFSAGYFIVRPLLNQQNR